MCFCFTAAAASICVRTVMSVCVGPGSSASPSYPPPQNHVIECSALTLRLLWTRVRGLRCQYCRATVRLAISIIPRETREQQALIGPHPQAALPPPRRKTFTKGVMFYATRLCLLTCVSCDRSFRTMSLN